MPMSPRPRTAPARPRSRTLPWIASAALGCGGALAQTAPEAPPAQPAPQPATLQRITVTGSNIKRTDLETASPVTVITREDLRRSGANTLGDVIANLGVAQGGQTGVEFSGFTPGAATVSLRGLGAGATLILINGRRIAPYGITGFQEVLTSVNSIPVSAIDRIDILKDGASAIYGSEAIAGVVNIIMRRDFNGFEAQLTHTDARAALRSSRLGLAGGKGDLAADHFNLFAIYEHLDQQASVVASNRFFPSRNITGLTGQADQDFRSAYSVPGNLLSGGVVKLLPGTSCPPAQVRTVRGTDRCVLDVFDYNTMSPRVQRDSLVSQATVELSPSATAFGEFNYSRARYGYQFDPQFYYNAPGSVTAAPGAPYGLPGTVNVLFRTGDIGPRRLGVQEDQYRLLGGLKGTWDRWDYDAALGLMGDRIALSQGGSVLTDPMEAAIASGRYVPGFTNDASVLALISPTLVRKGHTQTTFGDLRLATEFGQLPGGPVGVAAGLELRRESQADRYDPRMAAGEVFGFGSLQDLDSARTATSVHGELRLPVTASLEGQLAARYDRYSTGGKAVTPKAGVKWTVLPSLVARATWGRGFRVANAREVSPNASVGFYNGVQDPARCPQVDSTNPDCSLSIQANISGNPALAPEKSRSFTAGFVVEPTQDTSLTLDFWRIQRTNEITNLSLDYLLANQSTYTQYITRDASGSITRVDLPYINLSGTEVKGLDFELKGKASLGENGKLSYGGAVTRYLGYKVQPAPGAPADEYNGTYNQPKLRSSAYVGWEKGPWSTELRVTHVDGFSNRPSFSSPCSAPATLAQYCSVGSWDVLGLFVGYKGFRNIELTLNIANLLDKAPPFDYRALRNSQTTAWNPNYANANGRTLQLAAKYTF